MKNNKGFTLIELLVVVLIIGILAAIALPQYFKAVAKSRATEALIVVKNLKDAVDRYALAHGSIDANLDSIENDLDIEVNDNNNYAYTVTSAQITATPGAGNPGGVTLCYTYAVGDAAIAATAPTCQNGDNSAGVCQSLGTSVTVGNCPAAAAAAAGD